MTPDGVPHRARVGLPCASRLVTLWIVATASCTPPSGASTGPAASASERTSSAAPGAASLAAPPASGKATAAPLAETSRWSGTYTSARGAFHVPDGGEWEKYTWRGGDGGEGLGDGPMSLVVDGATHLVTGAAEGPLGEVVFQGTERDGALTAAVRRKDPTDRGLTGTLEANLSASEVTGTMRLSFGDAHVIREATLRLTRSSAP